MGGSERSERGGTMKAILGGADYFNEARRSLPACAASESG